MTNTEINKIVSSCIENRKEIDLSEIASNNVYISGCAQRICHYYIDFVKEVISKEDFELVIRDYLIASGESLIIHDYTADDTSREKFGLITDKKSLRTSALTDFPTYADTDFCLDAYSGQLVGQNNTPFELRTNSKIYDLSKYDSFRSEEQKIVVNCALNTPNGYTTILCMPTGGGKSLIAQTVSYQNENTLSVIIVPTISLMLDQVENARNTLNIGSKEEVMCYYSGCDDSEITALLKDKKIRMLFISPETMIKNHKISKALYEAREDGYLSNLIIDEAHIIVEWGSSFRQDFQCLDVIRNSLYKINPNLRTFLMSATFTEETINVIKQKFSSEEKCIEIRCDKLRNEIKFDIISAQSIEGMSKQEIINSLVCKLPHPMIVYVQSPYEAERMKTELQKIGIRNIREFTGDTNNNDRNGILHEWKNDNFPIMIATSAFGVGVDKKDVRTVIHTYIPENPDKYYQEAGRGGRDGAVSLACLVYDNDDFSKAYNHVNKVLTVEKLVGRWFSMFNAPGAKKGTGIAVLNTSINPSYIDNDDYAGLTSVKTVGNLMWNMYTVLFMSRNGLIKIENVDIVDDVYIFTVSILKKELMFGSSPSDIEKATAILGYYRDSEWLNNERQYKKLKRAISNKDSDCISDLFTEIYKYTDECCAGCNAHKKPLIQHISNTNPVKKIKIPAAEKSEKIETIVLCNDIEEVVKKLSADEPTAIVASSARIEAVRFAKEISSSSTEAFFNYSEFEMFDRYSDIVMPKCIIIECTDNLKQMSKIFKMKLQGKRVYYLATENIHYKELDKSLFEIKDVQIKSM